MVYAVIRRMRVNLYGWAACQVILPTVALAQGEMHFDYGCNYAGMEFNEVRWTYAAGADAQSTLAKVMSYTGLPTNFKLLGADVANAEASVRGSERYILYSPTFMEGVESATGTNWAGVSILAHEIGHHLSGHTLDGIGSRPDKELEADEFSGFVLFKMGASLEHAQAAMKVIGTDYPTVTHPARHARLAAITKGWNKAKAIDGGARSRGSTPMREMKEEMRIPSGRINRLWAEYDVFEGGQKGMRVHCNFDVNNWLDKPCEISAYFSFTNGTPLKDFNGAYCSVDGQVSTGIDVVPGYESANFGDLALFMPYDELHMDPGVAELMFHFVLFRKRGTEHFELARSTTMSFTYTWAPEPVIPVGVPRRRH